MDSKDQSWADAYSSAAEFVAMLTLEEKVNITRGFHDNENTCAGNTGSITRLNWHGLCIMDAGNGVRATDMVSAWSSGLHVGASWDKHLTYQRGLWMGREFKAKGGPNAGPLGRTPLGGRNWEGFSVDPYLSGQLVAETVKGIQDAGVMSNLKHWIANEQETYRRPYFGVESYSANIDDKTLHEYYIWPFMDGIRAGAASVLCSYNRVNNSYACESNHLLTDLLKEELGFKGFVMLDWNGQHNLGSATAGLDMVMPLGGLWGNNLTQAVRNGTVSEERVSDMALRILAGWFLLGQDQGFPVPGVGMKNMTEPHELIDARNVSSKPSLWESAVSGHVLVKNVNSTLPLKGLKMISVYGYDAATPPTKNTDTLFQAGLMSYPEMAQASFGEEHHFDQAARGGTVTVGGRAGANAPPYISDPLSAFQQKSIQDDMWINWDLVSIDPEVNAATQACLVFLNSMATEAWDREGLYDDFSDKLVRNVASKCGNTIVVIHAAGIRLVDQWINHPNVTATVIAHLPGQESGRALVSLLWGDDNFSGKLPYTIARNESDYPVYHVCDRGPTNSTEPQCDYTEGVYLDYRWFDAKNITPRFEFGYGLSYTTFSYTDLQVSLSEELLGTSANSNLWETIGTVQVQISNSGLVYGEEVAQLYMGIPGGPPKQLRGFEKAKLAPGDSIQLQFDLTRRDVSHWDTLSQTWLVQSGDYVILVGASSRDIRLQAKRQILID
ncbi:Beta-glucosidase cel3A [Beauveria bassiana]|uniref:Beta-glucosidase cel3A n=1 Tax=Beauveria bassiana TaxID=176275 RepID=A0A2N6NSL1_BEABA|nr:Beta-glucosidase cel3A [Beauveria bassiana]